MIDPKIVIGLGFGDEGKGMAVAHEVEKAIGCGLRPVVVRFNGGPQAGHNVRVRKGERIVHHTHSQFGSGAIVGAETYIAKGMIVDLDSLFWEGLALGDMFESVTIDKRCPVMLPMYSIVNQEIERARGDRRHGSTGRGVGVARSCVDAEPILRNAYGFAVRVCDLIDVKPRRCLRNHLAEWTTYLNRKYDVHLGYGRIEEYVYDLMESVRSLQARGVRFVEDVDELIADAVGNRPVIFEGSQGMLLDKRVGWFPHVTYGDMDAFEARRLCGGTRAKVIGVTRSYQTRHGFGPMPTEGTCDIPEIDNETYEWAGVFRTGLLDIPNLARAAAATCVDEIAISHMDRYPGAYVAIWHDRCHVDGIDRDVPCDPFVVKSDELLLVRMIEGACHAPVTVVGRGPTTDCWQDMKYLV